MKLHNFLISFGNLFLSGVVLVYLWTWFAVPLGVPEITYVHALGISALSQKLTHHGFIVYKNHELDPTVAQLALTFSMLSSWLVGWVVNFWM